MKKEVIQELYNGFEAVAVEVEGIECWSARELQLLLGYSKWENFSKVIDKAKTACVNAGYLVSDHFPGVRKMVHLGLGSEREIDDILLTRYACYLIAQNGIPRKEQTSTYRAPKHLVQSASLEVPKSHNDTLDCTLEEVALIKFVKEKPPLMRLWTNTWK